MHSMETVLGKLRTGQLSPGCEKGFGPWGLSLYGKQRRTACLGRDGEWGQSIASALCLAGGHQGSAEELSIQPLSLWSTSLMGHGMGPHWRRLGS